MLLFLDLSVGGFFLNMSPIKLSKKSKINTTSCPFSSKFITEHHLYQIYLDSSLSGYLSDVSTVKLPKDKKESISTLQSRMITVCASVFVFRQRNIHCSMIFPKAIQYWNRN